MAIGSNNITLKLDDVVAALLSKEMRWKNIQGSTSKASIRGRSIRKKKGKSSNGRSNLRRKSMLSLMSPNQSIKTCWECRNPGHYKRDCKLKGFKTCKYSEEIQSTKSK